MVKRFVICIQEYFLSLFIITTCIYKLCFDDIKMEAENIYTVIAAKLRQQIMQGDFKDGGVFPSELELTKRFQVTRTTVRHALDLLVNEGLLLKSQGRRNRVRIRKITKTTWNFASFSEGMRSSHEIPVSKVCKAEIVTTDDGRFFNLVRLRGIDRTPKVQFMTYEDTKVPIELFPQIERFDFSVVSLYETMRKEYGVYPFKGESQIFAVLADKFLAKSFAVTEGYPLVKAVQSIFDREGRLVEKVSIVYAPELIIKLTQDAGH